MSIGLLKVQAADKNHDNKDINPKIVDKIVCDVNSTHPQKFAVKNVCITRDYSIFNELVENNRAQLDLVFQEHKVVNVDDKKKEITLDVLVFLFWKDERIKAFFPPKQTFIELPPLRQDSNSKIWSPFRRIVIPNVRKQRYLREPLVANFLLLPADMVNGMWNNYSISSDSQIVHSVFYWSITISCPFKFSNFPFDKNECVFELMFINMDVSLRSAKQSVGNFIQQNVTDGFKITVQKIEPPDASHVNGVDSTNVKLSITLERQVPKYIYQYYIPCVLIVLASSFSFLIPLSAIPGRVALVVTQFLTLTNIFINQMVST